MENIKKIIEIMKSEKIHSISLLKIFNDDFEERELILVTFNSLEDLKSKAKELNINKIIQKEDSFCINYEFDYENYSFSYTEYPLKKGKPKIDFLEVD